MADGLPRLSACLCAMTRRRLMSSMIKQWITAFTPIAPPLVAFELLIFYCSLLTAETIRPSLPLIFSSLSPRPRLFFIDFSKEHYMKTMRHIRSGEGLRWVATAAFFCWTIFILLLLIIGLARKSKCCLFVFAAFGT